MCALKGTCWWEMGTELVAKKVSGLALHRLANVS